MLKESIISVPNTVPPLNIAEDVIKKKVQCSMCYKTFQTKGGLRRHLSKIHKITSTPSLMIDRPTIQKHFYCPFCGRSFVGKHDLHVHQVTQACIRADRLLRRFTGGWKCTSCDKNFDSRDLAERHTRTHEFGRGMFCPVCNENFTGSKGHVLVKHVKAQHPNFLMI